MRREVSGGRDGEHWRDGATFLSEARGGDSRRRASFSRGGAKSAEQDYVERSLL